MKIKKPTLKEIVTLCIAIQDSCGGLDANVIATEFISNHNLEKIHQKFTGNRIKSYPKLLGKKYKYLQFNCPKCCEKLHVKKCKDCGRVCDCYKP